VTTFDDVVTRTRVRLMGQQREPQNTLSVSVDADDDTINLTYDTKFIEGSRLCIGFECVYVTAVASTGNTATVIRGTEGSVAVAHDAGDMVHINPTWTTTEIAAAINEELADLSSPMAGLFQVKTATDIVYNPATSGYDLAGVTDLIDIWRVRYNVPEDHTAWPPIPRSMWRLDRAADSTEFPSGIQIVINQGGRAGHVIRVSYKASFAPLVNPTDDVLAVSGLHAEAHDILSLGAAYRLMGGSEAQRSYSTSQADPRRGDEASTTAHSRSMASFGQLLNDRIVSEQIRLARRYPEALG